MFDYVENELTSKYGVNSLYLATSSVNKKMQKAAESRGFSKVHTSENERGNGIHALIYRKDF